MPLYALIQSRAQKTHVARIVAANNILNALFIVVASLAAAALLGSGLTIPELFLVAALMNAAVAAYIYLLVPEFLLRFFAWLVAPRCIACGRRHRRLPTLVRVAVCNHVTLSMLATWRKPRDSLREGPQSSNPGSAVSIN